MDPRSAARVALCLAAGLTLATAVAARADVEPPASPAERLRVELPAGASSLVAG